MSYPNRTPFKRGQKKRTRLGRIRMLDVCLPLFAKDILCFCYLSLVDAKLPNVGLA